MFRESFLTKHLDTKEHETLANAMYKKSFAPGECIIRYGDIGDKYFVLSKG